MVPIGGNLSLIHGSNNPHPQEEHAAHKRVVDRADYWDFGIFNDVASYWSPGAYC